MDNEIKDVLGGDAPPPKTDDEMKAIKETVGSLAGTVKEVVEQMNNLPNVMAGMLANSIPPAVSPSNEEVDYNEDPEAAIEAKVKAEVGKARKEVSEEMRLAKDTEAWNDACNREFPEILDSNSDFYKMVKTEYQRSYNMKSPDAVYNAAARVHARTGMGKGKNVSEAIRAHSVNNANLAGSSFERSAPKKNELTDTDKYFAAKLGISEEKFLKAKMKGANNG